MNVGWHGSLRADVPNLHSARQFLTFESEANPWSTAERAGGLFQDESVRRVKGRELAGPVRHTPFGWLGTSRASADIA
jgi:hypothetical protein